MSRMKDTERFERAVLAETRELRRELVEARAERDALRARVEAMEAFVALARAGWDCDPESHTAERPCSFCKAEAVLP